MVFTWISWKMFLDRGVWAVGLGHFAEEKLPYLTDQTSQLDLESIRDYVHHNTFLAILTETGLIGLVLMLVVLLRWSMVGVSLVQSPRAPPWMHTHGLLFVGVLGVAVWQMLGHEITFTSIDQSLIYCLAGIAVGAQAMLQRDAKQSLATNNAFWPRAQLSRSR